MEKNASPAAMDESLRPRLQLVEVDKIRFHEATEEKRTKRLVERLKKEKLLRHPPIVGEMDNGGYLLLDGANRVTSFIALQYSHIPVQVVKYSTPQVQLHGWHHLLPEGGVLALRQCYADIADVEIRPVEGAQLADLLAFRHIYAVLGEHGDQYWGLFPKTEMISIEQRIVVLNQVVDAYEGSPIERVKLSEHTQLGTVLESKTHSLILVPAFRKEELLRLAAEGTLIPTGLTRHLIPGRALNINLALDFLDDNSTEQKQAYFQKWYDSLIMKGRIRFYGESVFLMDE